MRMVDDMACHEKATEYFKSHYFSEKTASDIRKNNEKVITEQGRRTRELRAEFEDRRLAKELNVSLNELRNGGSDE